MVASRCVGWLAAAACAAAGMAGRDGPRLSGRITNVLAPDETSAGLAGAAALVVVPAAAVGEKPAGTASGAGGAYTIELVGPGNVTIEYSLKDWVVFHPHTIDHRVGWSVASSGRAGADVEMIEV